jgi:hypothetical protein
VSLLSRRGVSLAAATGAAGFSLEDFSVGATGLASLVSVDLGVFGLSKRALLKGLGYKIFEPDIAQTQNWLLWMGAVLNCC